MLNDIATTIGIGAVYSTTIIYYWLYRPGWLDSSIDGCNYIIIFAHIYSKMYVLSLGWLILILNP